MESKNFLGSLTIWGVIMTVVPIIAPAVGIDFSADDATMVTNTVDGIIQGVGALLALIGRIRAKSTLTLF